MTKHVYLEKCRSTFVYMKAMFLKIVSKYFNWHYFVLHFTHLYNVGSGTTLCIHFLFEYSIPIGQFAGFTMMNCPQQRKEYKKMTEVKTSKTTQRNLQKKTDRNLNSQTSLFLFIYLLSFFLSSVSFRERIYTTVALSWTSHFLLFPLYHGVKLSFILSSFSNLQQTLCFSTPL